MSEHAKADTSPGPLAGIRVVDLSSVLMGPYATQQLGDLGADVIVIETAVGDTNRVMSAGPVPGLSGTALNVMRNKRAAAFDLKQPAGREVFLRLVATADVVVTNLRPGPLERLGLTAPELREVKPDLVFCRASGYPSDSPQAEDPAYDDIIQSASGIGHLFEMQGHEQSLLPTLVADKVAGLAMAQAVLAALFHRERTGEGQDIEVPMIDVMKTFVLVEHGGAAISEPPSGPPGHLRILTPERRPQRTADGWINVLPYTAEHYRALFVEGGRPDLAADERITSRQARFTNSDALYREVAAIVATRSSEEWLDFCRRAGIPCSPSARIEDLLAELPIVEHPVAGRYRQIPSPARFSVTPAAVTRHAPRRGEDSRDLLVELGYDGSTIDALEIAGVWFGVPEEAGGPV